MKDDRDNRVVWNEHWRRLNTERISISTDPGKTSESKGEEVFLSVILPTLNEAESLHFLLPRLLKTLDSLGCIYEIIVIDGNSQDDTPGEVKKFSEQNKPAWSSMLPILSLSTAWCRLVQQKLPGYGEALKLGFAKANGALLATMDADLSHHPGIIPDMVAVAEAMDADVVIGSRFVRGGMTEAPFFRVFLSKILNRFFRFSLNLPYHDLSSGFRLYRKRALKSLVLESSGYEILEEILVKLHIQGYRIVETPFRYRARKYGESHARVFAFGLRYLKLLPKLMKLRLRPEVLRRGYEGKGKNVS